MHRSTARGAILLLVAMFAGACGGDAPSIAAVPTDAGGGGAATDAAPATNGAGAATDARIATGPGSGGGVTGEAICDLATAEGLTAVFGVPVDTYYDPMAPKTCFVRSADDRVLAHWTMETDNAKLMYEALGGGDTQVSGLGDAAKHLENFGLMILKGDVGATVVVASESGLADDAAMDAAERVGALIVVGM